MKTVMLTKKPSGLEPIKKRAITDAKFFEELIIGQADLSPYNLTIDEKNTLDILIKVGTVPINANDYLTSSLFAKVKKSRLPEVRGIWA